MKVWYVTVMIAAGKRTHKIKAPSKEGAMIHARRSYPNAISISVISKAEWWAS